MSESLILDRDSGLDSNEHKFNHNFQDILSPLYSCSLEVESSSHFSALSLFHRHSKNPL